MDDNENGAELDSQLRDDEDDPRRDLNETGLSGNSLETWETVSANVLFDRVLPSDAGPVFHYCSAATLIAILTKRTLRFSDLSRLNDAEEQIWGERQVFLECLERLRSGRGVPVDFPHVPEEFLSALSSGWAQVAESFQPFVCCFSSDGDSLSQWRAYAADGQGFAIGFARTHFKGLPAHTMRVEYSPETQLSEMFSALKFIYELIPSNEHWNMADDAFESALIRLVGRSISYKNPAFRDEKEVRSAFLVGTSTTESGRILRPTAGYVSQRKSKLFDIQFEARNNVVVPFVDIPFSPENAKITHINIGPRSLNSVDDIRQLVGTLGLSSVQIDVAGSQYR
jgi:hypothetical protein